MYCEQVLNLYLFILFLNIISFFFEIKGIEKQKFNNILSHFKSGIFVVFKEHRSHVNLKNETLTM